MKNAKEIFKSGKPEDLTVNHVMEIVQNLYAKGLAEAWFIGMGWVEGYKYCANPEYLKKSFAPNGVKQYRRQIWFACTFLD